MDRPKRIVKKTVPFEYRQPAALTISSRRSTTLDDADKTSSKRINVRGSKRVSNSVSEKVASKQKKRAKIVTEARKVEATIANDRVPPTETTTDTQVIDSASSEPVAGTLKRSTAKQHSFSKKAFVESFRFENTDSDPIIDNLREISLKYNQVKSIDDEILEQIALEGLTGVTFGRLCLLLDAVITNFDSSSEDHAQDYLWSVVVKSFMRKSPGARVQAFHLDISQNKSPNKSSQHEACNKETLCEQSKNFCIDKAIKLPNQSLKRMAKSDWMLHPVLDGQIMGSCAKYMDRENISQELIDLYDELGPRKSLLITNRNYDLKNVYFVADQDVRHRALIPKSFDPNIDLKLREYACLELIGRTRCFGIVFPNDKTLGRYRILLTAKGLITQYQQTCNTFIIHHLRRFSKFNTDISTKAFKGGPVRPIGEKTVSFRSEESDDEDDDVEVETAVGKSISVRDICCNPANLKCDRDILKMVYGVIALSKGRSLLDIRRKLKMPKSHIRNHLKNLANTELIGSHTKIVLDKKTRIYRARHKSTKLKLARQRKLLKGVKSKWDEADLRARRFLGQRRSSFSQAEDSLLTLCRITGLLINPSYPKTFIVPKQVIRDILHDELSESHDKTSDSLLRRVKFLCRLQSNITLMNEITAELSDDSDIKRMIEANKDMSKSDEKRYNFFKQLLRAIRAKLPHLLGLTSTLLTESSIEIKNFEDLTKRYVLVECQKEATRKSAYHQPQCTLVQLVKSTPQCYRLNVTKCDDMQTVMLISSRCVQTSFNLRMKLKLPIRVVALDHDNENFKEIFEKAKESKEASRMIANLTTANPTADSRRALFMLRNALKLQTLDKCGKLADALIIQPCNIEFSSEEEVQFHGKQLLDEFLNKSKFSSEIRSKLEGQIHVQASKRKSSTTRGSSEAEESSLSKQDKLFKMIESILSWVGTYPGIVLETLQKRMAPLMGSRVDEHLNEILELMESLELISRDSMSVPAGDMRRRPRLFGYRPMTKDEEQPVITFAPRENAYVRLCQLIDVDL